MAWCKCLNGGRLWLEIGEYCWIIRVLLESLGDLGEIGWGGGSSLDWVGGAWVWLEHEKEVKTIKGGTKCHNIKPYLKWYDVNN